MGIINCYYAIYCYSPSVFLAIFPSWWEKLNERRWIQLGMREIRWFEKFSPAHFLNIIYLKQREFFLVLVCYNNVHAITQFIVTQPQDFYLFFHLDEKKIEWKTMEGDSLGNEWNQMIRKIQPSSICKYIWNNEFF